MAEAEWDDSTRDLALALEAVELCALCGNPISVCRDPARQDDWVAGDPVRCHAQTARLARHRGVTEESNPQHEALQFPVRLVGGF